MQKSYEAKVTTLRQTAVARDLQETRLWEARRNLVQKIYSSAQVFVFSVVAKELNKTLACYAGF